MDFGTIFSALIIGHYLADFWVQTDHQSRHKGLKGPDSWCGRWNAFKHAWTYSITLAFVVGGVGLATGEITTAHQVNTMFVLVALNGVTHYIIDRRWTLERFARFMRKGQWIDADKGAMMHLDQAAHIVILGAVALALVLLG